MLKVVAFMKQVADGLQMEGNFGTAHVYKSSLNAIVAFRGKGDFTFDEVTPEWLKDFEVHLRSRGCSWNTVSTYLRTFRAVYNRAVDSRKADYVPHLFRSVYTGTRADRKRALDEEDMKKVFAKLPHSSVVTPALQRAQGLFVLMFLLRGLPFVDLAYLRKSDLRDNVITYRRRKTPLGIPMLCGPGAIANAIVLMQDSHTYAMKGILIGTIALIYLLTFFILRASTRLVKVLGETGNNVMMRLMGLILMVIAVECFVSGAKPILADIVREGLSGICK